MIHDDDDKSEYSEWMHLCRLWLCLEHISFSSSYSYITVFKMFSLTEVQDVCVHISDIFMIGLWSSYTGPCHYPRKYTINVSTCTRADTFFTPAHFKSCLFFKFLLIYSKPCLVQLPRPYSIQKISWPPLDYLLWRRSCHFYQEFAWVENSMDSKWK